MRISIGSKIKKIGIAVLSSLMALSMGLGFAAINEKGVAKADGAGEAHFLYRDKKRGAVGIPVRQPRRKLRRIVYTARKGISFRIWSLFTIILDSRPVSP